MTAFTGFDEAVVVDVETTGLDPNRDRIVSVAMIHMRFGDLKKNSRLHGDTMDVMVNPQCRIPKAASRVHGITNSDVADLGPFSDVAQQLRDFIGNLPVISHNAAFDKSFLNSEFRRAGVKSLSRNKSYCTMQRYRTLNHGYWKGSKLDDVAKAMRVKGRKNRTHDATEDAYIVGEISIRFYMLDNQINVSGKKPGHYIFAILIVFSLIYWLW